MKSYEVVKHVWNLSRKEATLILDKTIANTKGWMCNNYTGSNYLYFCFKIPTSPKDYFKDALSIFFLTIVHL